MLRSAANGFFVCLAGVTACAIAITSCGVTSSGDCTDKATCEKPDAALAGDDAAADQTAPEGDDGMSVEVDTGADVTDDVTVDECVRVAAVENCENGIDDDCNGLTDCADLTACSGYNCAASAPSAWLGPVALWDAAAGQTPPPCPPGYGQPMDLHRDPTGPPVTCKCSCALSGVEDCETSAAISFDGACTATSVCSAALPKITSACSAFTNTRCGASFSVTAPLPTLNGGTCTPSVEMTPKVPVPPTWTGIARACTVLTADSPGGCSVANSQCVATPLPPYGSQTCIYQVVQGGAPIPACPAGFLANPKVYYSDILDGRGCSACNCKLVPGACSGMIDIYGGTDCGGAFTQYATGSACHAESISPAPTHLKGLFAPTSASTCGIGTDTIANDSVRGGGQATVFCCM